jgi:hypothetical protein
MMRDQKSEAMENKRFQTNAAIVASAPAEPSHTALSTSHL